MHCFNYSAERGTRDSHCTRCNESGWFGQDRPLDPEIYYGGRVELQPTTDNGYAAAVAVGWQQFCHNIWGNIEAVDSILLRHDSADFECSVCGVDTRLTCRIERCDRCDTSCCKYRCSSLFVRGEDIAWICRNCIILLPQAIIYDTDTEEEQDDRDNYRS